jgi:WD40 repeat protein
VWDLRTRRAPRVLRGHSGPVNAVAFFPDGRRVLSAGADGAIRIWSSALVLAGQ